MHRRQGFDQRQAQAGAFAGAGMGALHLFEGTAQPFQIGLGDAGAAVGHRDLKPGAGGAGRDPHIAAARGELDPVGDQIDQHLLDRALVGEGLLRRRRHRQLQRHAAPLRRRTDKADGGRRHLAKIEQFLMQFEFARLDLGHVEYAVDQVQQMAARFMDMSRILLIARAAHRTENLLDHHFGETNDGVQRRAQLVTHIGEKSGFGARGAFRRVARLDQGAFLALSLGNIPRHRDNIGGRGTVGRTAAYFRPDVTVVAVLEAHFRRSGAAQISRFHEGRLHRPQIVGVHQRRRGQALKLGRRAAQQSA